MLQSVHEAELTLAQEGTRNRKLSTKFYFVEKDPVAFKGLDESIRRAGFGHKIGESVFLIPGEFAKHSEQIAQKIQATKGGELAIYFLDQYGYSDVSVSLMRDIFRTTKGAEIILTIAMNWLIDFIHDAPQFDSTIANCGLELDANGLRQLKRQHNGAALIEGLLVEHIRQKSSAKYFTPFFLEPESNRKIWLIHLSNHYRARQEMMGVHWHLGTRMRHVGGGGLDAFAPANQIIKAGHGLQERLSPLVTGKQIILGYGGRKEENETLLLDLPFGDQLRTLSRKSLLQQIPALLHGNAAVEFGVLLKDCVNYCPADTPLWQEVLQELSDRKQLELRGAKGGMKRGGEIHESDIIKIPQQRSFCFLSSPHR